MAQMDYMSLLLIVMVQFTVTEQTISYLFARVGAEVTLSCKTGDEFNCDSTSWKFTAEKTPAAAAVTLFEFGEIHTDDKSKSDRLSVTENCSLVIKKVSAEDAGHYGCRQSKTSVFHLSVVSMTEEEVGDSVMLNCSVLTHDPSRYTVKWLYQGGDVDSAHGDLKTSRSGCWATVELQESHFIHTSKKHNLLTCNVTYTSIRTGNVHQFSLSPQSSGEGTASTNNDSPNQQDQWWLYVVGSVVAAVLLMTVTCVIKLKRSGGNKPQPDHSATDPEHDVSYASISFTRESHSNARVRGDDEDDEGDTVTYSTVKASSSSAGASTNVYSTSNFQNI
ncbi:uncharacterized protein [Trachinotus anak]|uniref:uncharacterized protein isoform X5 n=1 Tax=Trachinotus anak TaxID=443729 RepID=UPI0039F1D257